jgi:hypothetical protein
MSQEESVDRIGLRVETGGVGAHQAGAGIEQQTGGLDCEQGPLCPEKHETTGWNAERMEPFGQEGRVGLPISGR